MHTTLQGAPKDQMCCNHQHLCLSHPLFPFIITPFLELVNQDMSFGIRGTQHTTVQVGILPEA